MTTAAPPLAPDLVVALKRLKLRRIREIAPETLRAAKTQRWAPEELLRTFVEAEIAAREFKRSASLECRRRLNTDRPPSSRGQSSAVVDIEEGEGPIL